MDNLPEEPSMKRPLLTKCLLLVLMTLGLLVPLGLIQAQISARQERQGEVVRDIAASSARSQQLNGPVLVLNFTRQVLRDEAGTDAKVTRHLVRIADRTVLVPRRLELDGRVQVEERWRGLYKSRLFTLAGELQGEFELPVDGGMAPAEGVETGEAFLVLGLSDLRGFLKEPVLAWGNETHPFQAGSVTNACTPGIHVDLGPVARLRKGPVAFRIPLEILGTERLSFAPVADSTKVTLRSPWPDPGFGGRFLPTTRKVGPGGFEATWQVSHLARDLEKILVGGDTEESFHVRFTDPVNIYLQAERAVKYGILFVILTFGAFFLFELLSRRRIHPMQYLLAGLALAVFFLLLISLSEHVPFLAAYSLAGGACILLLGGYLTHVLGGRLRGLGAGLGLTLLYGVLYALLVSEDNALLMGTLLVFGALAAFMAATRRLDWYALGAPVPPPLPPLPPVLPVEPVSGWTVPENRP
jgi:inner membrane protein